MWGLPHTPLLLASKAIADWEFDKKAVSFQTVLFNQYLYPTINLRKGKPKSFFGRNLLSQCSIGILLLFPCHPSSWTNTGCGPPSPGRGISTCKGIDHLVSGLTSVTQALFTLCPSYHLRHCGHSLSLRLLPVRDKPRHNRQLPRSCFWTNDKTLNHLPSLQ